MVFSPFLSFLDSSPHSICGLAHFASEPFNYYSKFLVSIYVYIVVSLFSDHVYNVGNSWTVIVSGPEAAATLLRTEGKYPSRGHFEENMMWIYRNINKPYPMVYRYITYCIFHGAQFLWSLLWISYYLQKLDPQNKCNCTVQCIMSMIVLVLELTDLSIALCV